MRKSLLAVAALAALTVPAVAADLTVTPPEAPVAASGFNWEGGYIGGFGGLFTNSGIPTVGLELGYNFLPSESLVLGIEGSGLFYLDGSNDNELLVHGKVGAVINSAILYATAGVGTYDLGSIQLWDVGAGVEFALSDNLTGDVQVFGRNAIGSTPDVIHVQGGVRSHF